MGQRQDASAPHAFNTGKQMNKIGKGLCILIICLGIGIYLYPIVSNWIADNKYTAEISDYQHTVKEMNAKKMDQERKKAEEYNENLANAMAKEPSVSGTKAVRPEGYGDIRNIDGMMGSLEIPSIDVNLPIFHGTGEETLRRGAAHLEGTALPIGGAGNHTVLSAHNGFPKSKLFTNLDKVKMGDVFYLHILDETLAYQVNQIKVVLPYETENLQPVPDRDYVTLLTCTPYTVNTHRLLVRGTRISYEEGEDSIKNNNEDRRQGIPYQLILLTSIVTLTVLAIVILIVKRRRDEENKKDS